MRQDLPETGKGETFTLDAVYKNPDGTPVSLIGHTVGFVLRKATSGTAIASSAATVTALGVITVTVADEVTDLWPVGRHAYVLVHTPPGGAEKSLMWGALPVFSGVDL
jgi:hypothetical protein